MASFRRFRFGNAPPAVRGMRLGDTRDRSSDASIHANVEPAENLRRVRTVRAFAGRGFVKPPGAPVGRTLLEASEQSVFFTDPDGVIRYVNPAFEEQTGYEAEEVLGKDPSLLRCDEHAPDFYERMWESVRAGDTWRDEVTCRRRDGSVFFVRRTLRPVEDEEGCRTGYLAMDVDITPRIRLREELENRAFYDELTELPNRALLYNRLEKAMEKEQRDPGRGFFLMFLDVDRFRRVNNSLGHGEGDRILREIAGRLEGAIRPWDTVARFGGDEFVVLLEETRDLHNARKITRRLLGRVREPIEVKGRRINLDATAGLVLSSPDYGEADTLIRDADTAMYRAKQNDTDFEFFTESMHDRLLKQFRLGNSLREALEDEQFVLHYQPIVDLRDGSLQGFEGLIRWNHPEEGFTAPGDFIPEAERSGLIVPLGRWVLEEAVGQMHRWREEGLIDDGVAMHVNHSPRELSERDFLDTVESILKGERVPRECLNLEFTESTVNRSIDFLDDRMEHLGSLGLRLCVDDFGTGYSSIARLSRWPIDFLKIDHSFVSGMAEDPDRRDLTRGIVEFSGRIDLEVIAEGVETPEEHRMLHEWGCPTGQGFYYARPRSCGEITRLLRQRRDGEALYADKA